MEAARTEPVRITRKSGEAFVLLNADVFEKMQMDLARLQGLTAGLIESVEGRMILATKQSTSDALNRAKTRVLSSKKT